MILKPMEMIRSLVRTGPAKVERKVHGAYTVQPSMVQAPIEFIDLGRWVLFLFTNSLQR